MSCGISSSFPEVFPTSGQVTHVLLTRPPLDCRVAPTISFDLHVLSTPPAFILSQDQTLHLKSFHDTANEGHAVNNLYIELKSCCSGSPRLDESRKGLLFITEKAGKNN